MEISDVLMVMILLFFLLSMCIWQLPIPLLTLWLQIIYTQIFLLLINGNGRQYGMVIIHVMIHNIRECIQEFIIPATSLVIKIWLPGRVQQLDLFILLYQAGNIGDLYTEISVISYRTIKIF